MPRRINTNPETIADPTDAASLREFIGNRHTTVARLKQHIKDHMGIHITSLVSPERAKAGKTEPLKKDLIRFIESTFDACSTPDDQRVWIQRFNGEQVLPNSITFPVEALSKKALIQMLRTFSHPNPSALTINEMREQLKTYRAGSEKLMEGGHSEPQVLRQFRESAEGAQLPAMPDETVAIKPTKTNDPSQSTALEAPALPPSSYNAHSPEFLFHDGFKTLQAVLFDVPVLTHTSAPEDLIGSTTSLNGEYIAKLIHDTILHASSAVNNPYFVDRASRALVRGEQHMDEELIKMMDHRANYKVRLSVNGSAMVRLSDGPFFGRNEARLWRMPSLSSKLTGRDVDINEFLSNDYLKKLIEIVNEWIEKCDEAAQKMAQRSDAYAQFESIEDLTITFRFIEVEPRGMVRLVDETKWTDRLYSPLVESGCFIACLEKFAAEVQRNPQYGMPCTKRGGYRYAAPTIDASTLVTTLGGASPDSDKPQWTFIDMLKNHGFTNNIPLSRLKELYGLFSPHLIFKVYTMDERMPPSERKFKPDPIISPKGMMKTTCEPFRVVTLGVVMNHFVLILDQDAIATVMETDFIREEVRTQDRSLEDSGLGGRSLSIQEPSVASLTLLRDVGTAAVDDKTIEDRIKKHQDQDKRAGRRYNKSQYITLEYVRELLNATKGICSKCHKPLTFSGWSIDRIQSYGMNELNIETRLAHVKGNVQIICHHCNVSKRDSSDELFNATDGQRNEYFWDIETYRKLIMKGNAVHDVLPESTESTAPENKAKQRRNAEQRKKIVIDHQYSYAIVPRLKTSSAEPMNLLVGRLKERAEQCTPADREVLRYMDLYVNESKNAWIGRMLNIISDGGATQPQISSTPIKTTDADYERLCERYGCDLFIKNYYFGVDASEHQRFWLEYTVMNRKRYYESLILKLINGILKSKSDKTPEKRQEHAKSRVISTINGLSKNSMIVYAHNAGRFDSQFLLKDTKLHFSKFINSNGLISLVHRSELLEIRDTSRMASGSLASLCRDFKLPEEFSKGSFPHMWMNEERVKRMKAGELFDLPPPEYWNDRYIPPELTQAPFDPMALTKHYQIMDVIALELVWNAFEEKLRTAITELKGESVAASFRISNYLTLPAFAYALAASCFPPAVMTIQSRQVSDFIRKSLQGGRTFPQISAYESSGYQQLNALLTASDEELIGDAQARLGRTLKREEYRREIDVEKEERQKRAVELFNGLDDYCVDFDAVSLYPSAMASYDYPIGTPAWSKSSALEEIATVLNGVTLETDVNKLSFSKGDGVAQPLIGVLEVDIKYKNPSIVCPLLATRRSTLEYTLEDTTHIVKTTVDLAEAVRYNNVEIVTVHRALLWPRRAPIFKEFITTMFEARAAAKKKGENALQVCYKLIMNASYGKFAQRLIDSEDMILNGARELEQLEEHCADYNKKNAGRAQKRVEGLELLANWDQALVKYHSPAQEERKPVVLSTFILAFSKVIMNRAINAFDGFNDWETTFYYTDTDSLHIHKRSVDLLRARFPDIEGKNLCQLHDDIDEVLNGKIIKSYFIRPKLYVDVICGYDRNKKLTIVLHKRAKGVTKGFARSMGLDDYRSLHEGNQLFVSEDRWKREPKRGDSAAIQHTIVDKVVNKEMWSGRSYDPETFRFIPFVNGQRAKAPTKGQSTKDTRKEQSDAIKKQRALFTERVLPLIKKN